MEKITLQKNIKIATLSVLLFCIIGYSVYSFQVSQAPFGDKRMVGLTYLGMPQITCTDCPLPIYYRNNKEDTDCTITIVTSSETLETLGKKSDKKPEILSIKTQSFAERYEEKGTTKYVFDAVEDILFTKYCIDTFDKQLGSE